MSSDATDLAARTARTRALRRISAARDGRAGLYTRRYGPTAEADLLAYAAVKSDEAFEADRALLAGHPLYGALNLYPDDVDALFAKRASVLAQAEAFAS